MSSAAACKKCVYYACGDNQLINNEVTYFKFPPNPEKAQIWAQRAEVPIDECLKNRYLCEKHFSPIYINRGHKRTTLLSTAVPYAINEDESNFIAPINPIVTRAPHNMKTNQFYSELNDEEIEFVNEDELVVESNAKGVVVTIDSRKRKPQPVSDADSNDELFVVGKSAQKQNTGSNSSRTVKKPKCMAVELDEFDEMEEENHTALNSDTVYVEDEMLDGAEEIVIEPTAKKPDVTKTANLEKEIPKNFFVFINEGEQWIQMPKKVYLEQIATIQQLQRELTSVQSETSTRMERLEEELKRHQKFVKSIKGQFDKF